MNGISRGRKREYDYMGVRTYIADFIKAYGYSPSIREIMSGCGIASSSTTLRILRVLRQSGYIEFSDRICRTIKLVH